MSLRTQKKGDSRPISRPVRRGCRLLCWALGALTASCALNASGQPIPQFGPPQYVKPLVDHEILSEDMRLGDINNDGRLEILQTISERIGDQLLYRAVTFFAPTADGSFTPRYYLFPELTSEARLADMNDDGAVDVVAYRGILYISDGATTPTFTRDDSLSSFRVGGIADLNGDGHTDIVSADGSNWFENDGSAHPKFFVQSLPRPNSAYVNAVGDFNADGHEDILLSSSYDTRYSRLLYLLINDGGNSPSFTWHEILAVQVPAYYRVSAERGLDGDSQVGMMLTPTGGHAGPVTYWSYQSDSHDFVGRILSAPRAGETVEEVEVGDLNADGHPDLLVRFSSHAVIGLINNGEPVSTFTSETLTNTVGETKDWRIGDLDGDGAPDLVYIDFRGIPVWMRQNGPPRNVWPTDGLPVASRNLKLRGTSFNVTGEPQLATEWQVSLSDSFSSPVLDSGAVVGAATSYTLPVSLEPSQTYYWRVRHRLNGDDWTSWSMATAFTVVDATPLRVPADFATIQQAIDAAVAGQEVWVNAGTYAERLTMRSHVAVYGGFTGDEASPRQRDLDVNATVLKADTATTGAIVSMRGLDAAVFDGFVITGDYSSSSPYFLQGIDASNDDSRCTVRNCRIYGTNFQDSDSSIRTFSGLLLVQSEVSVTSCSLTGNSVTDGNLVLIDIGSGIAYDDIRTLRSQPRISFTEVAGNRRTEGVASLILLSSTDSSPIIQSCRFETQDDQQNEAHSTWIRNGSVHVYDSDFSGGVLSIDSETKFEDCKFTQNDSLNPNIEISAGTTSFRSCLIRGGATGVKFSDSWRYPANAELSNCVLTQCSDAVDADLGDDPASALKLINCTIASNQSAGVRIVNENLPCHVDIVNSIFYHNPFAMDFYNKGGITGTAIFCLFDSNDIVMRTNYAYYPPVQPAKTVSEGLAKFGSYFRYSIEGPANLVDPENGDYHPGKNSAAARRAYGPAAPDDDFDGRVRPKTDGVADLGAYESDEPRTDLILTGPGGGTKLIAGRPVDLSWWSAKDTSGTAIRLELWKGSKKVADLGTVYDSSDYVDASVSLPSGESLEPGDDYTIMAVSDFDPSISTRTAPPFTILARAQVPTQAWVLYR